MLVFCLTLTLIWSTVQIGESWDNQSLEIKYWTLRYINSTILTPIWISFRFFQPENLWLHQLFIISYRQLLCPLPLHPLSYQFQTNIVVLYSSYNIENSLNHIIVLEHIWTAKDFKTTNSRIFLLWNCIYDSRSLITVIRFLADKTLNCSQT